MEYLSQAFRSLRRSPGFAAIAIVTLAIGIAANTVVFAVARTLLFRPMGFDSSESLMWVKGINELTGASNDRLSWREKEDLRESAQSFEAVALFGSPGGIWERSDRAESVSALSVTPELAQVLGIRLSRGRMIQSSDTQRGAARVVLISHELWQSEFGGRQDIIGQVVRLDQASRVIVGVLPPQLQFPLERVPKLSTGGYVQTGVQSFWLPMEQPQGSDRTSRAARMNFLVARLKNGVSVQSARAELNVLSASLARQFPESNRDWTFTVVSFRDQILGRTKQGLPILAAAVVAVLLTSCVNLANLLLARSVARRRDSMVRLALGAGPRQILLDGLAECIVISIAAGAVGIVIADACLRFLRQWAAASLPFSKELAIDGGMVLFALIASVISSLALGLFPAMKGAKADGSHLLHSSARTTTGSQIRQWQQALLVAQLAAVVVLLLAAGLLTESFRRLVGQEMGYHAQPAIAVELLTWGMQSNEEVCQLYRKIHAGLSSLPQVEAVGTVSSAPLTAKWTFDEKVQVVGKPMPEADRPSIAATFVAFDYFEAMGISLLEGRVFRYSELEDKGYGQKVILNQAAAEILLPGRSAIGGRFTVGSNPDRILEVIGVVSNTRDVRLEEKPGPRFYWQYAFGGAQVVVRSAMPSKALIPVLRDTLQKIDGRILNIEAKPMEEILAATVAERQFLTGLTGAYALVAMGIAAVGILGVVAYQVAQRTKELGVRMALGSTPSGLTGLVLYQSVRVVLWGLALGNVLSVITNHFLAAQLFGISPQDPSVRILVSVLILAMSMLASWWPAHRASRVNPMDALRAS